MWRFLEGGVYGRSRRRRRCCCCEKFSALRNSLPFYSQFSSDEMLKGGNRGPSAKPPFLRWVVVTWPWWKAEKHFLTIFTESLKFVQQSFSITSCLLSASPPFVYYFFFIFPRLSWPLQSGINEQNLSGSSCLLSSSRVFRFHSKYRRGILEHPSYVVRERIFFVSGSWSSPQITRATPQLPLAFIIDISKMVKVQS